MIALDTNVLIELMVDSMSDHDVTTSKIKKLDDDFCTTQTNVGECLRLLTHPKLFSKPLKASLAVTTLKELFEYYQIRILEEDANWWHEVIQIEKSIPGLRGNEIFDARIAICLKSNNVKKIYTRDADFKKYSFLQLV